MKKIVAEAIGTATLVFVGCGAATIGADPTGGGMVAIALAFGLTLTGMAYAIGGVSGCHVNPAVTLSMLVTGRIKGKEGISYMIAQFVGAVIGAGLLYLVLSGAANATLPITSLGQNGWGVGYLGEYNLVAAMVVEVFATLVFTLTILEVTRVRGGMDVVAGVVIGLFLTAIIIAFINVTGLSVNPARSFGPALLVGGVAIKQMWLFIIAPAIGAGLSGSFYRYLHGSEN